jgi:hypothetical protein
MQDWILQYKETVYCIANGKITEHIIASGLSMRDALDLQSQDRLFPTREAARAHIGKTGAKMDITTFNAMHKAQQAKIFDAECNKPGAITRSPGGAIGGSSADFVFVDGTALVCLDSEGSTTYFACEAQSAEAQLDRTIDWGKREAEEEGLQFGDWQLIGAYIEAAKSLARYSMA